jgi:GNAT superfamily N-acetyltransferase
MNLVDLPAGYALVSKTDISPVEVMDLRGAVGWGRETESVWTQCIENSLITVGVKDASGILVGVGFLAGSIRHAILCDLTVHPEHQRRGIGRAIINQRINMIYELEVRYVYADISDTNTLHKYYLTLGFVDSGHAIFLDRVNKK